ncbi:MAG: hypothetical protein RIS47_2023 [Bacteroidota bacterium]|jgi:threonine aldolase
MTHPHFKGFASDNNAAVHPAVLEALATANQGHAIAYGDDPYTLHAQALIRAEFTPEAEVFFVFLGTAANTLGLQAATQSYHAIICAETAHIQVDECGAPERFTQCKLLPVATNNGKITPEGVQQYLHGFGFEHHSQPRVISITQTTELGTLYTPAEIRALADLAHAHGMYLHIDGARIANAAAALGCSLREISSDCGADILSLGGTKNGMMYGEAIVFFRPELAQNFKYIRKQGMQLASKMRYISAQFQAMFTHELWRTNAQHANAMARELALQLQQIPEIQLSQTVQANGIFAIVPPEIIEPLRQKFFFYTWNETRNEVRWMTSWDTTTTEIDQFVAEIKKLLHQA